MRLLHLSFNAKLEGIWKPRSPHTQLPKDTPITKLRHDSPIAEPDTPRISVSPTIKQCFQAIYPNISKYFEEKNFPYMEMYVYSPQITNTLKIITPETLTKKRMVWDAYKTEEHWITQPVRMKLIAKIKVYNTADSGCETIKPFNDARYDSSTHGNFSLCPIKVEHEVITHYDESMSLEADNNDVTYVYHYSKHKLSELKTLKQQNVLDKETMDRYELGAKNRHQPYPYHEHISFFIERPPLDIIHELYPKDHPAWSKGTELYEYLVPVANINMKHWRLVESNMDGFMLHLYIRNDKYLDKWYKARSTLKLWMNEAGDTHEGLIKAINKYKGTIRKAYLKHDRKESYQYASNVPHLMIYVDSPVKVNTPTKVTIGDKKLMSTQHPHMSLEKKADSSEQSGVVAFITSKDHPNKMFTLFHKWRDHMSIPSGTIDDGETPEETLLREMNEELGINVTSFKKLTVIKHRGMEPDGNLVDFTSHIFHVDGFNGVITNMELDSHSNLGYRGLEHIMFANPTDDITKYASTWLPKASSNDSLDLLSAFKEQFTQLSMASYTPTESKDYPGWYLSPGYEYFLANEEGAIRNANTGRLLKGSINDSGYVIVAAWDNATKKKKDYKAHRVVCSAFKGPAPTKEHEVGHKNDKRDDNRPTNLQWTTRAKNMARVHIK